MSDRREEKVISEEKAADLVRDGMTIAIGGFINCSHPMPIVRQMIRRGVRNLTVVGPASSGLDLDLLVAGGCVRKLVSAHFGAETITPISPMIKHAAEQGTIEIFECDEGMYYAGIRAGAQRLPFLPTRAGVGTSYPAINPELKLFSDPIRGEPLLAVPAIRPDIAFLYAAYSDVYGNVQHEATGYGDRSLYKASEKTIVCVEKVVSNQQIRRDPLKTSIPGADAIVRTPFGSHPYSSPGFYLLDKEHLEMYLGAVKSYTKDGSRERLDRYLEKYVLGPKDHVEYLEAVGLRRLFSLSEF